METLTLEQLLVLVGYFLAVYLYKYALTKLPIGNKYAALMRSMIPAVNLIAGLLLGYFGVAGYDITASVIGMMATGGVADLVKTPTNASRAMTEGETN